MAKERLWRATWRGTVALGSALSLAACSSQKEPTRPTAARAAVSQPPPGRVVAERGTARAVTPEEAELIAANAYIFGYPLVVMDVTRRVMTAVPRPDAERMRAPINQVVSAPRFPDPSFTDVVRPNFDTLYSSAWLDLNAEPAILSVPDMGERYYLMPMLDAWTNVIASPGTRTSGRGPSTYVIIGPRYAGNVPADAHVVRSPTRYVWMIGRIATRPGADVKAVNELQNQIRVKLLGRSGAPADARTAPATVDPSVDTKTPPPAQVARMKPEQFFGRFAELTRDNPPSAADAPIVASMARLGIVPGAAFDAGALGPEVRAAIERGAARGQRTIEEQTARAVDGPGWTTMGPNVGSYGTDYMTRAKVALGGLGANLTADAVYPVTDRDANGRPLDGRHRYVLRFREPPPTKAFWSLTVYDDKGYAIKNALNRYSIGSQYPLTRDEDGSVTLFIQSEEPRDEQSRANWLPAPRGPFNLTLRIYEPDARVNDGSWKIPAVERVP